MNICPCPLRNAFGFSCGLFLRESTTLALIINFYIQKYSMSSFWNSPAWTMGTRSLKNKKNTLHNPGPGNYSSSTNIGKHQPAWKIGNAGRDGFKLNDVPGPGDYNLNGSKSGPKITMSSKPKVNSFGQTLAPGPGNYNLQSNSVYKNPSAFTMGSKYGSKVEDPEPGPGNYNVNSEFKLTGAKMGKSKRGGLGCQNQVPGPGQYNQTRPISAGPKYGFSNEVKSTNTLEYKPGPGQYDAHEVSMYPNRGCTIGEKTGKKNYAHDNPGPGSYDVGVKRPMSGTKIGKSGRSGQGSGIGPGPGAYDFGYKTKGATEVKIGSSLRSNFGKAENPGPGAYELIKSNMKGITISGVKSKHQIEISPGPGAYELRDEGQRPCSAKIGKSMRSNMGQSDTPGPGQYYPKDRQHYQFAFGKELRSKEMKGGDPGPGQYEIPSTVPNAPHYLLDPSIYKSNI